jgi:hypothetical protein
MFRESIENFCLSPLVCTFMEDQLVFELLRDKQVSHGCVCYPPILYIDRERDAFAPDERDEWKKQEEVERILFARNP